MYCELIRAGHRETVKYRRVAELLDVQAVLQALEQNLDLTVRERVEPGFPRGRRNDREVSRGFLRLG